MSKAQLDKIFNYLNLSVQLKNESNESFKQASKKLNLGDKKAYNNIGSLPIRIKDKFFLRNKVYDDLIKSTDDLKTTGDFLNHLDRGRDLELFSTYFGKFLDEYKSIKYIDFNALKTMWNEFKSIHKLMFIPPVKPLGKIGYKSTVYDKLTKKLMEGEEKEVKYEEIPEELEKYKKPFRNIYSDEYYTKMMGIEKPKLPAKKIRKAVKLEHVPIESESLFPRKYLGLKEIAKENPFYLKNWEKIVKLPSDLKLGPEIHKSPVFIRGVEEAKKIMGNISSYNEKGELKQAEKPYVEEELEEGKKELSNKLKKKQIDNIDALIYQEEQRLLNLKEAVEKAGFSDIPEEKEKELLDLSASYDYNDKIVKLKELKQRILNGETYNIDKNGEKKYINVHQEIINILRETPSPTRKDTPEINNNVDVDDVRHIVYKLKNGVNLSKNEIVSILNLTGESKESFRDNLDTRKTTSAQRRIYRNLLADHLEMYYLPPKEIEIPAEESGMEQKSFETQGAAALNKIVEPKIETQGAPVDQKTQEIERQIKQQQHIKETLEYIIEKMKDKKVDPKKPGLTNNEFTFIYEITGMDSNDVQTIYLYQPDDLVAKLQRRLHEIDKDLSFLKNTQEESLFE